MLGQQVRRSPWFKGADMTLNRYRVVAPALPAARDALSFSLYLTIKRLFDLVVSALALIVLSPLMVLVAVAIKLDSPGPAIFIQRRVGKNGRIFDFYKFRSMRPDIENDRAHRRFAEAYITGKNPEAVADENGALIYKPKNGNSVTRVGKILRATSLDELPQLFNVLKGDMSLVGPRPSIHYEVDLYRDWHRRRLAATPGLTGYAQINGRSSLRFDEIVNLDLEYIEKQSFWLDLKILLLTVPVVLSARSAR
jgi:lipopolysaccharide/colanic/teichoic acid biosynthesis glycosyltransferase